MKEVTSKQWHKYEEALERSEKLWEEENERVKEEVRTKETPPLKINGKTWGDYTPRINKQPRS